jgi:hypothetical protein
MEALLASAGRVRDLVPDGANWSSPWWRSYMRTVLILRPLTGSAGVPNQYWLLPCHTSQSWQLSWSCLGPVAMWT